MILPHLFVRRVDGRLDRTQRIASGLVCHIGIKSAEIATGKKGNNDTVHARKCVAGSVYQAEGRNKSERVSRGLRVPCHANPKLKTAAVKQTKRIKTGERNKRTVHFLHNCSKRTKKNKNRRDE